MFARQFLAALRALTFWPSRDEGGSLGPATVFLPAVGLVIGAAAALADVAAARLALPGRAVLAVLLLGGLTAFQNQKAIVRLGDSLRFWRDRGRTLEAMSDDRRGTLGTVLVLLAIVLKLAALWQPGPLQPWALFFAPMLGRWGMVVVAFSARRAREGAPGPRYDAAITFQEFGWASVFTAGILLVAIDAVGLVALLGVAAVSVLLRLLWHRWLGGVATTPLRAGGELAEIAALALFALFRSH